MAKKSYIIRVYDHLESSDHENRLERMDGIVEDVDTGIKHAFHNKEELWLFMTEPGKGLVKSKSKKPNEIK